MSTWYEDPNAGEIMSANEIMSAGEAALVWQAKLGHAVERCTTDGSVPLVFVTIAGLRVRPDAEHYRAALVICERDDDGHLTAAEITVYDLADPQPLSTRTIAVDGWFDREQAALDAMAKYE